MPTRGRGAAGLPSKFLALGLGLWAASGLDASGDDFVVVPAPAKKAPKPSKKAPVPTSGTLGYGPPGPHPGFPGFGLNFHPGYGYGGRALGVGAEGGFPFYGGPGYPHPAPALNRCGRESLFAYFGGPGFATAECPNFFGIVGPLVPDRPAVEIADEPDEVDPGSGYGSYTGLVPYPESTFAPFTTQYGTAGSDAGIGTVIPPVPTPPTPPPSTPPSAGRWPGLETAPVVSRDGKRGLKVVKVEPGGRAEKAGLRAGDEIRSANDYATEQPGNLTWVVEKAATDDMLRLTVLAPGDGKTRAVNVRLR